MATYGDGPYGAGGFNITVNGEPVLAGLKLTAGWMLRTTTTARGELVAISRPVLLLPLTQFGYFSLACLIENNNQRIIVLVRHPTSYSRGYNSPLSCSVLTYYLIYYFILCNWPLVVKMMVHLTHLASTSFLRPAHSFDSLLV
jgi:hypothetical protein